MQTRKYEIKSTSKANLFQYQTHYYNIWCSTTSFFLWANTDKNCSHSCNNLSSSLLTRRVLCLAKRNTLKFYMRSQELFKCWICILPVTSLLLTSKHNMLMVIRWQYFLENNLWKLYQISMRWLKIQRNHNARSVVIKTPTELKNTQVLKFVVSPPVIKLK